MPKPLKPTQSSRPLWLKIALIVPIVILATVSILFFLRPQPTKLDAKFSGSSEAIDITKTAYEQAITSRESFVIMVDNDSCITTRKMREMLNYFPDDLQFKYYRIMWPEATQTSLHQYVKYFPSLAVIREGQVVAWLRADSDDDARYYNDTSALQSWLREHITIATP